MTTHHRTHFTTLSIILFVLSALFIFTASASEPGFQGKSPSGRTSAGGKIVFGWVTFDDTKWPPPYSGGSIPADSIPWDVLTHASLFAANGQNPPQSHYIAQYPHLSARAHQSGVDAGICVGGSGDAALVTMIAGGPISWLPWIQTYLGYLDGSRMDFIDFDLEGSYSAANVEGFFSLLYDSLNVSSRYSGNNPNRKPYIVLTVSVPRAISLSSATIRSKVEFVNLMTYDYNNNAWGRVTFDNSPKSYKYFNGTGGATDSVGSGVNAVAPSMQRMAFRVNGAGWPMSKLNVGVDFNGGYWSGATVIRQSTSGTSSGGSNATFAGEWDTFVGIPADSIFFDQIAQAYWARVGTRLWTWLTLPGRDSGMIATRKVIDSMGIAGVCLWNLGDEVWGSSPTPPGGRGWFFSQIRQHFNFGPYVPPPPPGTPKLKGEIFFDGDQDGVQDAGEPAMAGWTVRLTGPVTSEAVTDSAGTFAFKSLPLGEYTLSLDARALWSQTFPNPTANHSISITSSDQVIDADFGAFSVSAFPFPVGRNWNIISTPVIAPDMAAEALFPLGSTFAYSFHNEYRIEPVLETGEGYWMKFPTGHEVWTAGSPVATETVDVSTGWNFIGSVDKPILVGDLYTIPSGLLSRYIYGFQTGAYIASQIEPGKGYWVDASAPGKVVIANTGNTPTGGSTVPRPDSNLNELVFISATGERQSLYFSFDADMTAAYPAPPAPPGNPFSALFRRGTPQDGGSIVEVFTPEATSTASIPVVLVNAAFPMSIAWKIAPGNLGGKLSTGSGRSIDLEGTGGFSGFYPDGSGTGATTLFLSGPSDGVSAVPEAYSLEQNYPNPFNGTTVISFSTVYEGRVTLDVYNVLGEKIMTLIDRTLAPGVHSTSISGDKIATGVYVYRLTAETPEGGRFLATRKLVHVK